MKLLLSDTHFNNWKQFSHITNKGINSRLETQYKILCNIILRSVSEYGIDEIYHLGDFFHKFGKDSIDVLNIGKECIVNHSYVHWKILTGNHDFGIIDNKYYNSLHILNNNNVETISKIVIHDKSIFIPYIRKTEQFEATIFEIRKRLEYQIEDYTIFAHITPIQISSKFGTIDAKIFNGFKNVYLGHYHNYKDYKHILNIGSPYHLNSDDTGTRYITILDNDNNIYDTFSIRHPKFYTIKSIDDKTDNYNYYTLLGNIDNISNIDNNVRLIPILTNKIKSRFTGLDIFDAYLQFCKDKKIPEQLIRQGKEYLDNKISSIVKLNTLNVDITIDKIIAYDFLSYKELNLSLINNGIYTIHGNSGTGKSAIYEAIYYGLFGKLLRKTSPIKYGKNECSVYISGYNGDIYFEINRTSNYVTLTLFDDKNNKIQLNSNKPKDNIAINEFFQIKPEHFTLVSLFGQLSYKFTQENDVSRKNIIETFIDTSIIKYMLDDILDRLIKTKTEHVEIAEKLKHETTSKNQLQQLIDEVKSEITDINTEIVELQKRELKLINILLDNNIESIDYFSIKQNQIKRTIREKLDNLQTCQDTGKCKLCFQSINEKTLKKMLNNAEIELTPLYDGLEKMNEIEPYVTDLKNLRLEIRYKKDAIVTLNQNKLSLERKVSQITLDSNNKNIADVQYKLDFLEFMKIVLSKDGIISYIIDSFLIILNEICKKISKQITRNDFCVTISPFKENKNGTISDKIDIEINYSGKIVKYEALSQGEKRNIDNIVMFAFRELFSQIYGYVNILFYDEIFESLDLELSEYILEYITNLANKYCIFVITHNSAISTESNNQYICEKIKNTSNLKQIN
jgi:ABC-type lipoprotein export system ATPase subunit